MTPVMEAPKDICSIHEQHIELIQEIRNDTKWIRRIGVGIGMLSLALLPFVIGLFVYISRMDVRITVVEYKISKHIGDKQ